MEGTSESQIINMVGHLFRHEAGKMAAVLSRKLGIASLDIIEDIVQDTLLRALETWKIKGIPENPTAWLHKVAWNRSIDYLRNKKRDQSLVKNTLPDDLFEHASDIGDEKEIQDAMLRMMFACCHPAIPIESQIAFTLKTLGGLSVREIAKAFLASEETIAKRIYRAKEKMREEKIEPDSPSIYEIPERLHVVLKVLYLLFNEGYYSANPEYVIREDLCEEAMRLTHLLLQNKYTAQPSVRALLSLMCFQVSRFNARRDNHNNIILLENQDRSQWNKDLMEQGFRLLRESTITEYLTEYHVEASIASVHAVAKDFNSTNWEELVRLYDTLEEIKPSEMVSFNKAIAVGYAQSPQNGIDAMQRITGLDANQYYHAALGNFYLMAGEPKHAKLAFKEALRLTQSPSEIELLQKKLKAC